MTTVNRSLAFFHADLHPGNLIILPGPHIDIKAFRHNVEDICRRWQRTANFSVLSIGRLILESVTRSAVHRMYFPVEMVLMVKAIVTFEGVGNYLKPGFDVATVSRSHINRLFLSQFSPLRGARETCAARLNREDEEATSRSVPPTLWYNCPSCCTAALEVGTTFPGPPDDGPV